MTIQQANVGNRQIRQQTQELDGTVIAEETATDEQNKTPDNPDGKTDQSRNFRYPLAMGNDYPAKIIFRVFEIKDQNLFENAGIGVEKIWDQLKQGFADFSLNEQNQKRTGAQYPSDAVGNEYTTPEEATRQVNDSNSARPENQSYENKNTGKEIGIVTLPLQRPLRYADVAQYEGASLGVIGGGLGDIVSGRNPFEGISENGRLKSAAGALAAQVVAQSVGAAAGIAAGSVGGLGGAIVGGLVGAQTGDQFGAAVKNTSRIASAPNLRSLFSHAELRNFSFDFRMIATSKEESEAINGIIKLFRQELYPEKIPLGATGLPFAYKFPNVFEIEVKNKFQKTMGFKFQRCYLRNVQTTFNETATGVFSDGNFIEVSVSLDFVEVVALDKQKVRDEGY